MSKHVYRLALVVISLIAAVALCELYLRQFAPQQTIASIKGLYDFPCYEKGSYYYMKLRPNTLCALKSNVNAFPDISIRTNSLGFRNEEVKSEKPANSTRILFIGDSFTMGVGVSEEEAYPKVVQTQLTQTNPHRTIESINGGVNGTGPGYYYLTLKNEGIRLNPDIVVVGFFPWNDIANDIYYSERVVQKDSEGAPQTIDSRTTYVDGTGSLRQKSIPLRFRIPLLSSSQLVGLLMSRISPITDLPEVIPSTQLRMCIFKSNCRDMDQAKETAKNYFIRMKQLTDKKGIPLLIVMIPAEFQVYDNASVKYSFPPLLPTQKWAVSREFSKFFESIGLDYVDLLPVFLEHPDKKPYFDRDPHWNSLGHAIAAEAITKKLQEYLMKQQ